MLGTHPMVHKRRYKTYFITCTIKLQPEYKHLAKTFSPILNVNHHEHQKAIEHYPNLNTLVNHIRHHPTPRILFALIVTISPNITSCEYQVSNASEIEWTLTLLNKMLLLSNPPERHISTQHPYTQFINENTKL